MSILLGFLLNIALAQPRLIEYGPGKQAWLREEAFERLKNISHEVGHCGGGIDVTHLPLAPQSQLPRLIDFKNRKIQHQTTLEKLLPNLSQATLAGTVQDLSTKFKNRGHRTKTGVAASQYIQSLYETHAKGRSDIKVSTVKHGFAQSSVVARIEGNGANKDEVVIVGAHMDSIQGFFGTEDMDAPGADDDASGTATIIEAFRVLAGSDFIPNRTFEFMSFAGEEAGLLGSGQIANEYRTKKIKVAAMIQFDMTGFPNSENQVTFIEDSVDSDLTAFVKKVASTYTNAKIGGSRCGYGCSDHASFTRSGFASAFPFEAPFNSSNKRIHTNKDLTNILNFEFAMHFARIALATLVELSS